MPNSQPPITTDITVLREMVRLAENLRTETLQSLDRLNQYNVALIAFNAGFLSFLVSNGFERGIIQIAGALSLVSMFFSILTLVPQRIKSATLRIDTDVAAIKRGESIDLPTFLLITAEITDRAYLGLQTRARRRKMLTILSAFFLVMALTATYALYAYA